MATTPVTDQGPIPWHLAANEPTTITTRQPWFAELAEATGLAGDCSAAGEAFATVDSSDLETPLSAAFAFFVVQQPLGAGFFSSLAQWAHSSCAWLQPSFLAAAINSGMGAMS
jgi:hypothetical protein